MANTKSKDRKCVTLICHIATCHTTFLQAILSLYLYLRWWFPHCAAKKDFLLSDNKELRGRNLMHGRGTAEMTAMTSYFWEWSAFHGFTCQVGERERREAKMERVMKEIHQQPVSQKHSSNWIHLLQQMIILFNSSALKAKINANMLKVALAV